VEDASMVEFISSRFSFGNTDWLDKTS
jgi:hypothetical protein